MRKLVLLLGFLTLSPLAFAGVQWNYRPTTKTSNVQGSATGTVLWTPAAGTGIYLFGCLASTDSGGASTGPSVRFQSAGTDIIPPLYLTTGSVVAYYPPGGVVYVAPGNTITYTSTAIGNNLSVACTGVEQ